MFPDFPEVKAHFRGALIRWMQHQVPQIAPLLGEVGRFSQHEGRRGQLVREDLSTETLEYPGSSPSGRRRGFAASCARKSRCARALRRIQGTAL